MIIDRVVEMSSEGAGQVSGNSIDVCAFLFWTFLTAVIKKKFGTIWSFPCGIAALYTESFYLSQSEVYVRESAAVSPGVWQQYVGQSFSQGHQPPGPPAGQLQ